MKIKLRDGDTMLIMVKDGEVVHFTANMSLPRGVCEAGDRRIAGWSVGGNGVEAGWRGRGDQFEILFRVSASGAHGSAGGGAEKV